jgi:SAM-dependent methyltransferase
MNAERTCRACGTVPLQPVLNLGEQPLANGLIRPEHLDEPEHRIPLILAWCEHCTLLQLIDSPSPEKLFRNYVYLSSFSDTMLDHAAKLCKRLVIERQLTSHSLVIEAASNDGYLLKNYRAAGINVLGIEPARNVAEIARTRESIPTRDEFFTEELAKELVRDGCSADVFHAHNVFAHVPDINGFLRAIHLILKKDGIAVVEVPYAKCMIDQCEFDTIYHEHIFYFSLTALYQLITRSELILQDVELVPIHGGSLRLFLGKHGQTSKHVESMLHAEQLWGVNSRKLYDRFADRVVRIRANLVDLLRTLKHQGKQIAAYGASAKGSTLLNYCSIDREILDFIVDRSVMKQGLFTPGTKLLIEAPEKLVTLRPDYTLLLTWNFAEEILHQQSDYRTKGGRFITPIPEPRIL